MLFGSVRVFHYNVEDWRSVSTGHEMLFSRDAPMRRLEDVN